MARPFAAETPEDRADDLRALRAEVRDIIPISRYLWKRAAIDGDADAKLHRHVLRRLEVASQDPKDAA